VSSSKHLIEQLEARLAELFDAPCTGQQPCVLATDERDLCLRCLSIARLNGVVAALAQYDDEEAKD